MVGKVLGKRYQIVERIGGGGMALVFRAVDIQLGRDVAVKLLRGTFGGDEEFVRRFRREAQSAASLSHPNVVQIYDVGQDEDQYFIVMELIEGKTLKELIQQQGPVPIAEAARIAMEILGALSHAHYHRIVHRDIKPHNILISRDGRVKVTDFGIARATSTDTVTHTGSIMGSAHYFSPEQANGQVTGEKSDLYSLGIVLYEMVTGAVPFQGDSPISVALKHIRERPLHPSSRNPEVPQELDELILRALEKEPEDRFESAEAMRQELAAFAAAHAAGKTRVVTGDFPTMDLRSMKTKGSRLEDEEEDEVSAKPHPSRRTVRPRQRKRFRIPGWVWFLAFLVIMGGGLAYGYQAVRDFLDVPEVAMPEVEGKPLAEAQAILRDVGLRGNVVGDQHSDLPVNHVIRASEPAGKMKKQNSEIELIISKGPLEFALPDVRGRSEDQAKVILSNDRLVVGQVTRKFATEPEGTVIEMSPAPRTPMKPGDAVDLVVSQGPRRVPSVIGMSLADARKKLEELGLVVGTPVYQTDATQPKDTVLASDPPQGTPATENQRVILTVSQGPAPQGNKITKSFELPGENGATHFYTVTVVDTVNGVTTESTPPAIHGERKAGETVTIQVEFFGTAYIRIVRDGAEVEQIPLP